MPDEDPTESPKMPLKVQFALAVAFISGMVVILVFAVSSRVANAFTAAGTISLAVATIWLGSQTRDAVQINEREMDQNRDLLELTRQQAISAQSSVRILAESNRPFVSLEQSSTIGIFEDADSFIIDIPLHNYGASVALIETGIHGPTAILARDGDRFSLGTPDTVVIPKETGATVSFKFDKSKIARAGGPVMKPDGSYIALSLDYWFMDASKVTHNFVHAEFEIAGKAVLGPLDTLRLTNIEFGPPLPIDIDGVDMRSVPEWIILGTSDNP
jgi:hypothetical protein